jgi:hypothetical protein
MVSASHTALITASLRLRSVVMRLASYFVLSLKVKIFKPFLIINYKNVVFSLKTQKLKYTTL